MSVFDAPSALGRKRSQKFFSEEKNQKTFICWLWRQGLAWPPSCRGRESKSLLVLFFRKELLP
jgi:hypothetical protein